MIKTDPAVIPETDLAPVKPQIDPADLVVHDASDFAMLFDTARFNQAWRAAKMFSDSKMVPVHYQGKVADVFVALHLATRMNLDPFMVMSKTYPIQGRIGMEAQLVIALVNARGPFRGPIQWRMEGEGDSRKCTAYAVHAKTGETCEAPVTWQMVKAEGWASKSGSKWQTMPEMMFRYRSAVFLARLFCPETIMGLSTTDEIQDTEDIIEAEATPVPLNDKRPQTESLKDELKGRKTRSDKGTHRAYEMPQDAKEGQPPGPGPASGVEAPQPPPQTATAEIIRSIREGIAILSLSEANLCMEWEVSRLEELDQESAEKMRADLRQKANKKEEIE